MRHGRESTRRDHAAHDECMYDPEPSGAGIASRIIHSAESPSQNISIGSPQRVHVAWVTSDGARTIYGQQQRARRGGCERTHEERAVRRREGALGACTAGDAVALEELCSLATVPSLPVIGFAH